MTEAQFIIKLERYIKHKYIRAGIAAKKWGVSPQFVSKVLNFHSSPTQVMLDDIGYKRETRKVVTYKEDK